MAPGGATPPAGRAPGPDIRAWFTRERILFASIFLLVVALASVITMLVGGDDEPESAKAPPRLTAVEPPKPVDTLGTLVIDSYPSGAKVKVGAEWLPESTPTRMKTPAGKEVKIRVVLDESYLPYDTRVTPEPGKETQVYARLEKRRGVLIVESRPSGASVFVEGRDVGRTPLTERDLALTGATRVRVTKDGFEPFEQTIEWGETTEQRVTAELEPVEVARPAVTRRASRSARRSPSRSSARQDPPRSRSRAESRTPSRSRSSGTPSRPRGGGSSERDRRTGVGYLSVQARRWGSVFLNGKKIALETPLVRYKVPAGRHTVYLHYGDDGSQKSKTKRVTITPGENRLVKF
jgi:hypothetical protein